MAAACIARSSPAAFARTDPGQEISPRPAFRGNHNSSVPRNIPTMHLKTIPKVESHGAAFGSATATTFSRSSAQARPAAVAPSSPQPSISLHTYQESQLADGQTSGATTFSGFNARAQPASVSPSSPQPSMILGTYQEDQFTDGHGSGDSTPEKKHDPRHLLDVESLIQRIHDNVVVKDMPIKNPQWIDVPKGYLMDLETQPLKFYKERGEIRSEVKKRKREGSLTRSTTARGWQDGQGVRGFRPEEVNWNGAVCMEDCPPSTLSNAIHPIFDRSAFDDTPDAIYDELIPGLQLATLFLTQPICMQFWVTLALGHRRKDPEMSAMNGKASQRIDHHVELTEERAKTVLQHIDDVGKSKLIHFRFKRSLSTVTGEDKGDAYGISLPICDYQGIDTEYHGVDRSHVRSLIRIHSDYYVAAKKLSKLRYQEESQKLRFNFGFAVLIVHEVAHSIEGIHFRKRAQQWIDWHSCRWYKEPYWLDWSVSECGRAWEQTMFGGHIQPINAKVDGSHGVAVADWPFGGPDEDPRKYRWWTISMDYIVHMFQQQTWQQSFDLSSDTHIFDIPRDGATSLFINSFSTMAQSEQERVAKEEAADLIARVKEEPAKKKRVKGMGSTEDRRPDEADVKQIEVVAPAASSITSPNSEQGNTVAHQSRRLLLTPHPQKRPSASGAPVFGSEPQKKKKKGKLIVQPKSPTAQSAPLDTQTAVQRQCSQDQKHRGREKQRKDELTGKMLAALHANQPTSRLKSKPTGIFGRHKARKLVKLAHRHTKAARGMEHEVRVAVQHALSDVEELEQAGTESVGHDRSETLDVAEHSKSRQARPQEGQKYDQVVVSGNLEVEGDEADLDMEKVEESP